MPKAIVDAYRGFLYIDTEAAAILRLTLVARPLPVPVRKGTLTLDYADAALRGGVFNLPLSFTVTVQLQRGAKIRNEAVFHHYQRSSASSRVLP